MQASGPLRSFLNLCHSLGMHGDFLISSTHAGFFLFVCFFSVLVFNVCFPKGRKKKMKKERALGLPIPRTLLRPEREGLETNVVRYLPRHQQQQSEHRSLMFGQPNPSCPPWLPQAMHKLLQEYMQGHLPWAEGLEVHVHAHTCSLTHSVTSNSSRSHGLVHGYTSGSSVHGI